MTEFDRSSPVINSGTIEHWCFGCGSLNESGLHLRFRAHRDRSVWAEFTPTRAHEGYLGMAHGGILATLLDEAMSWAVTRDGDIGVTARMDVAFRRPARVDVPLLVIGEVCRKRSRTIDTRAEVRAVDSGEIVATAEGRFVRVSPAQADEWRASYGAQTDGTVFGAAVSRQAGSATGEAAR